MSNNVKSKAGQIILNKLTSIQQRMETGQEPELKECDFVLNCYKTFISEEVANHLIDITSIPTEDLNAALRAQMTTAAQFKLIENGEL